MTPERSVAANSAKSVLFEEINDIDIFIEDTAYGYEKLFRELFSRVFADYYKIEKVFPLGGRQAVLEEYNTQKDKITRPTLFIIDGDLLLLTGAITENQRGLYTLPFYCIENVLIDQSALHDLLNEEEPVKQLEHLVSEFDSNSFYRPKIKSCLWPLTVLTKI